MNDTHPLLQCHDLCKVYRDGNTTTQVLNNVNFSLQPAELLAIVGSSGSGKSTLLHLLSGLDNATSGEVIFKNQPLSQLSSKQKAHLRNKELGFIYQFHHLLPDFTALENAAMPRLIAGVSAKRAKQDAMEMLAAVGLAHRFNHRPAELSGGERQRVAIARALVNNPSLVMADEPTGNLDQRTAEAILTLISDLKQQQQTAFLIVTHDLKLASCLNRQLEMRDGCLSSQDRLMGVQE